MAMTRWDPFRELAGIQSELNRLFGRSFGTGLDETSRSSEWAPALDLQESKDRFVRIEVKAKA